MNTKQLRKCLKLCKNKYETEYSGNADLKNIKKISNTGINRISVGAITHSAKIYLILSLIIFLILLEQQLILQLDSKWRTRNII